MVPVATSPHQVDWAPACIEQESTQRIARFTRLVTIRRRSFASGSPSRRPPNYCSRQCRPPHTSDGRPWLCPNEQHLMGDLACEGSAARPGHMFEHARSDWTADQPRTRHQTPQNVFSLFQRRHLRKVGKGMRDRSSGQDRPARSAARTRRDGSAMSKIDHDSAARRVADQVDRVRAARPEKTMRSAHEITRRFRPRCLRLTRRGPADRPHRSMQRPRFRSGSVRRTSGPIQSHAIGERQVRDRRLPGRRDHDYQLKQCHRNLSWG